MIAHFFDLNKCKKKKNDAIYGNDFCMFVFLKKKKFALIFHRDVEFFKSSIS